MAPYTPTMAYSIEWHCQTPHTFNHPSPSEESKQIDVCSSNLATRETLQSADLVIKQWGRGCSSYSQNAIICRRRYHCSTRTSCSLIRRLRLCRNTACPRFETAFHTGWRTPVIWNQCNRRSLWTESGGGRRTRAYNCLAFRHCLRENLIELRFVDHRRVALSLWREVQSKATETLLHRKRQQGLSLAK